MGELSAEVLAAVAQRLDNINNQTVFHLEDLIRSTKFTKQEIRTMYRGFKQECPGGTVNEETFREIYEKFFPYGNATCYAHHLFKAFDVNSTGAISFRDMLISLSTLLHGTQSEKLDWTFRVYDLNGDGLITKEELGNVVVGVCELMGVNLLPQTNSEPDLGYIPRRRDSVTCEDGCWLNSPVNLTISVEELKNSVEKVFAKLDTNRDGVITREEFVHNCLKDETISESLDNFQPQL